MSSEATTRRGAPAAAGEAGDVRRHYAEELATGHFTSDPEQLAVVARLEDLRRRVLSVHASGIALPRWLAAVTGRRRSR